MALTTEAALRKDRTTAQGAKMDGLQHRHFSFIAATLAELKPDPTWLAETDQWNATVKTFADACQRSNPRFDRARFMRACGVE